jgi:hypothetical protein
LSEVIGELLSDFLGCDLWPEAPHDRSGSIDQELGEVPGDVLLAFLVRLLGLEELIELTGPVAVDLDFGEHRKIDVVLRLGEFQDLGVGSGLLGAELVARKGENREALGPVIFVECTQTCVLGGEASLGCDVDHQTDLILEARQRDRVARDRCHLEVADASHELFSSVNRCESMHKPA